jgi:hypothetical protein
MPDSASRGNADAPALIYLAGDGDAPCWLDPLTPAETATVLAGLYWIVNRAQLQDSVRALAGGEVLDDVALNRLIADLEHGRVVLRRIRPAALDPRRV